MAKVVNLLSAKMEMGAIMISMYLLGNPDHYTSHKFVPFYWQTYVSEARKVWHPEEATSFSIKVALLKLKGKIIGLSPVFDYIYRAPELENMSLYDWIRRFKREKMTKKSKSKLDNTASDDPNNGDKGDLSMQSELIGDQSFESVDTEYSSEDKPPTLTEVKKNKYQFYQFTNTHPLYNPHHIKVGPDDDNIVVNFIGANLPHCDQGDREYYCSTMLTLFKPWQTGKELKFSIESWNDAFSNYLFTERQLELMKNFNI
ncbi:hypothetical protein L208DRAFT_1260384 [Tricholoma matsutake]|nr:hypothetical protein L208DRAFT_1260384 [Tricholoma matsutake 945]